MSQPAAATRIRSASLALGAVAAVIALAVVPHALRADSAPLSLMWGSTGRPIAAGAGLQSNPVACSDGGGGAFIAWIDNRNGNADLFATHIDANGNTVPGWTAQGDAICVNPSAPAPPRIVPDGSGGAIVVWTDARSGLNQVWAMRLLANQPTDPAWRTDGSRVSSDSLTAQDLLYIAREGAGGVFVAWRSNGDFHLGHLNGVGAPVSGWDPNGKTIGQGVSSLAPDESGGVWVGGGTSVQFFHNAAMTHFNSAGAVLAALSLTDYYPTNLVLPDGQDGVLATYDLAGRFSRIRSDGTIVWTAGGVAGAAASDNAGGQFILTNVANVGEVQMQHYDATGAVPIVWQPSGVTVCSTNGSVSTSSLIPDGMSGAVVTWLDTRDGTSQLYGQHVGGDTSIPTGTANGTKLCIVGGQRKSHTLLPSTGLSAIEVWQDTRFDGGDIYAQRISWDGAVPVAYALASAKAFSDHVDIAWYAAGAPVAIAIERTGQGDGQWAEVGHATPDGTGFIAFSDRSVTSGERYGYRLRLPDGGVQGETWVDIPMLQLSLAGAVPNPVSGPLRIAFALPNAQHAQIQLFDISGRRVFAREVGGLGAGSHLLDLTDQRFRAGVYLVRLQQGDRALSRRVLLLQ